MIAWKHIWKDYMGLDWLWLTWHAKQLRSYFMLDFILSKPLSTDYNAGFTPSIIYNIVKEILQNKKCYFWSSPFYYQTIVAFS